jgi:hypothetical protein
MDKQRFLEACAAADNAHNELGIGTYKQKTLHAVLKLYFEPDITKHEVRVCGSVADIYNDEGIFEIQTRELYKLKTKLEKFLPEHRVTLVYPIAHLKWLCWVDGESGEVTNKRKSPKTGGPWAVLRELYGIKTFINHPNFRLIVLLIDMVEYRNLDGWGRDKKRGSSRNERIPTELYKELRIESTADYIKLMPEGLSQSFTVTDFSKAARMWKKDAQSAVNVLFHVGVIVKTGKRGRENLYERAK